MLDRLRLSLAGWLLPKARYEGAWPSIDRAWIPATMQPARLDLSACTRRQLQGKSRYWKKNSGLMNRMSALFQTGTVGSGLVVQPNSSSPEYNLAARTYWETWAAGEPDVGSRQPFGILQSILARTFFVDGEFFVVLVVTEDREPRIQILEADYVGTPQGQVDSQSLADGVVLDKAGKPVAYHVAGTETPVPSESMVHIFKPGRIGDVRGIPAIHAVLNDLADLEEVQSLTKQCVKNDATLWSIIKTATGELSPTQMRAARFGVTSTGTTPTTPTCPPVTAETHYQQVFGASAKVLRTGDTWESFHSDRPTTNSQEFMRSLAEKIAAGSGFPLVLVLPESLQGTIARGTYELASAYFRQESQFIANGISAIYRFVVDTGAKKVPALKDRPVDWMRVTIRPPRSINVDPGRRSTAAINELKAGVTNYDVLFGELGLDWKEEFQKLKEQQDYARAIGLNLEMPGLEEGAIEPLSDDNEGMPMPRRNGDLLGVD